MRSAIQLFPSYSADVLRHVCAAMQCNETMYMRFCNGRASRPIGLYRENSIAIESEARYPFGANGHIRLGNFVEHFDSVEHISYSTGTSRNSVEHKIYQEKCL